MIDNRVAVGGILPRHNLKQRSPGGEGLAQIASSGMSTSRCTPNDLSQRGDENEVRADARPTPMDVSEVAPNPSSHRYDFTNPNSITSDYRQSSSLHSQSSIASTSGSFHRPPPSVSTLDSMDRSEFSDDLSSMSTAHSTTAGDDGSERAGGLDVVTIEPVMPSLLCILCRLVLNVPIQVECGHRVCKSCYDEAQRKSLDPRCPKDGQPLRMNFKDRHCEREVASLRVKCQRNNQCDWIGELKHLKEHQLICAYEPVRCANQGCYRMVQRGLLAAHMEHDCSYRKVLCEYCHSPISENMLEAHVQTGCPDWPMPCPSEGCREQVTRGTLQQHLRSQCKEAGQLCTLGCNAMVKRKDWDAHKTDQNAMAAHMDSLSKTLSGVERQVSEKDDCIERLQQEIKLLKNMLGDRNLQKRVDSLAEKVENLQAPRPAGNVSGLELARIEERMTSLSRKLVDSSISQRKLEDTAERQGTICQELNRQYERIDLRVLELETTSYDGFLIWKIRHFSSLRADAKAGIKTSHYSQPFYCGRYGYKACARLYPNGDGAGKDGYISLFFAIMGGEYDAILAWPFTRRVTLTLLDQSPARRHISETFSPDIRSSSFQRPTTGLNVASGCPCFISHELLMSSSYQYVKDDTIFLRIKVDILGMEQC